MNIFRFILFLLSILTSHLYAQDNQQARLVFYNTENFFDIYDDSLKNDDEFTYNGSKKWTKYRYKKKLENIYKVLINIGDWEPPSIIGLCEVENHWVLNDLIKNSPLNKFGYKIIHKESPDERGIDVAMLYLEEKFKPLYYNLYKLDFPTREILYVKGFFLSTDTVHLFINHWPSRWGGKIETEPKRIKTANLLKQKTDSIFHFDPEAHIILMGDFNDEPQDKSLTEVLNSVFLSERKNEKLINLMEEEHKAGKGTITTSKPFLQWFVYDHFMVSASLINGGSFKIKYSRAFIFDPPWLIDNEKKRPYRTYRGPVYLGGYSDHLPVYIDVQIP